MTAEQSRSTRLILPAALVVVLTVMSGCRPSPASNTTASTGTDESSQTAPRDSAPATGKTGKADDADKPDTADDTTGDGVSLKPDEIDALGIRTTPARATRNAPEAQGYGVVQAHDAIAQAVFDLQTAVAGERQSRAALERLKQLVGTPGALPVDALESASRQAASDQASLELATRRLSALLGEDAPWKDPQHSAALVALATGHSKLVRVTFPLGVLISDKPQSLRLSRLDAVEGGKSGHSNTLWRAPADPAVPGVSVFALLPDSLFSEGEHLLAWTPNGPTQSGVFIPASAAVTTGGRFYCYVEVKPGTYVRTAFDPARSLDDGYFIRDGITAGQNIVTTAAGQLLARELNPAKEAE